MRLHLRNESERADVLCADRARRNKARRRQFRQSTGLHSQPKDKREWSREVVALFEMLDGGGNPLWRSPLGERFDFKKTRRHRR